MGDIVMGVIWAADQAANTGGEGAFTQWVWVELIESSETICLANTHQVHAEFI